MELLGGFEPPTSFLPSDMRNKCLIRDALPPVRSAQKYGAKVSELETAVNLWEKMLDKTTTAVEDGTVQKNTAEAVKYMIGYDSTPPYVAVEEDILKMFQKMNG